MKKDNKTSVRLGIVGLGNMGGQHARWVLDGKVPGLDLAAVCDVNPARLKGYGDVPTYDDAVRMMRSGAIDAVLIATPHYDHTPLGIAGLQAGLHVLVEKPISVHKADCERLIKAHTNRRQIFAAMFNQRTDRYYQRIRELVRGGELGTIRRVQWTITNWFRTEAYYASGGWRATWAGEGGGVLLNQCPHNLDLFQWIFGMPARVRAFCSLGRYHDIEVEDDVTAYLEYPDGATAVFITSTGEAPGTNRLEIAAERGRLVYEDKQLAFLRNEIPMTEYSRTTTEHFGRPATWTATIPVTQTGEQHVGILKNFARAILHGEPLLAPAAEGIHSVELANAMQYSSMLGKTVDLPLSARAYERHLMGLIAASKKKQQKKAKKPRAASAAQDFSASFGR